VLNSSRNTCGVFLRAVKKRHAMAKQFRIELAPESLFPPAGISSGWFNLEQPVGVGVSAGLWYPGPG